MIYYIRVKPKDYPMLLKLGKMLGAIEEITPQEGEPYISAPGGCWDVIGTIYKPTGKLLTTEQGETPEMVPVCADDGTEYIHINISTPVSLKAAAMELAAKSPEVAEGLRYLSKYFMLAENGDARAPAEPARVFL